MKKVLLLEDLEAHQELYGQIISQEGFEPVVRPNGFEGLRTLLTEGKFYAVIADEHMPIMKGDQFVHAIRKGYQEMVGKLPVLIHTMSELEVNETRVLELPEVYFHKKTENKDYILNFLKNRQI